MAVGDFTGDGFLDIVTANSSDNTISVLLGNGDGTFQSQQTYSVGSTPAVVAVGDFTGDGFLDIVTTNAGDSTVSVLLGDGNGTFQPQQTFPVGSGPAGVAVGDFNGDGRLDIATANLGDNTISVLLREPLVVEAATIQPVATVPFSGVVAIISNANSASDTTAAIDWGDSTPPTSGTVIANPDGTLTVSGTHIYASPGTFPLTVNADEGTFHAQGVGQALVQPPLVVQANTISATANVPFSGAVASISGATMAADTTTLINWGDGSPATVGMVSGSSSMLTVSGSHTYTQGGTFTLTVSATEDTRSAQSTGQAVVQPPLALTAQNISALAGVVFNGQVATGTFAGLSGPFSAIINWGDGNTTLGTVTVTGSGTFAVTGTHTYANSGNFLLTVTVVDTNGHSATSTSMATVTAPLTITVLTITSVEGAPFSGQVASGTFTGITGPFTATISWGDGTPSSSGTVLVSGNTFTVNGSHTYTEEGSYPLTVTVSDTSGHQITGSGTATVSDAPLTLNSMSVSALLRTATLSATFTDANPFADASDFQATIAWGDNTTTQGTVRKNVFGNSFSVSGSHTYSRTGTFTVTLTIAERDDGQPSVQGTRTVTIFL